MSLPRAATALLVLLLCSGCMPGPYPVDVFQEMHYTQVQRRDEPNRAPPPADSVPTSGRPPQLSYSQASQLANPLPADPTTLARGRQLADTNCSVCHGPGGDGLPSSLLAPYFQNNPAAPVAPVAYTSARVRSRSDGQLYWIVDHGLGNMPSFQGRLSPDDLWAVVAYVRQQAGQ